MIYKRRCVFYLKIKELFSYLYNGTRDNQGNIIMYEPIKLKELIINKLLEMGPLPYIEDVIRTYAQTNKLYLHSGGKTNKPLRKQQPTKLLFGKVRRIYKKSGDKKDYVKHKGLLITIKQYKDIRVRATKNRGK